MPPNCRIPNQLAIPIIKTQKELTYPIGLHTHTHACDDRFISVGPVIMRTVWKNAEIYIKVLVKYLDRHARRVARGSTDMARRAAAAARRQRDAAVIQIRLRRRRWRRRIQRQSRARNGSDGSDRLVHMLFIFICVRSYAVITLPYTEYIWLLFLNTCMLARKAHRPPAVRGPTADCMCVIECSRSRDQLASGVETTLLTSRCRICRNGGLKLIVYHCNPEQISMHEIL